MMHTLKGYVFTITAGILFGLTPLLAKTIYASGSNAMTLALARMVSGAIIFFFLHRICEKGSILLSWNTLKKTLVCALAYVVTPILVYSAYNYMDSGLVTTIHFIYPVLVLLGTVWFFHAKLTVQKLCCCILCFLGVMCFYDPGGESSLRGIVMVLVSAVAYAFYTIYLNESELLSLPLFQLSFWLCIFSAAVLVPVVLLSGQLALPQTSFGWWILALYGCAMATALITFQKGNIHIGAQRAAVLSVFEPLTSVIVGILVFQEKLTIRILAGFLCVLLSVCLLNKGPKKRSVSSKGV